MVPALVHSPTNSGGVTSGVRMRIFWSAVWLFGTGSSSAAVT